jgi:hypothetical protein
VRKIADSTEAGRSGGFYLQFIGMSKKEAADVREGAAYFLRLAHIIANGIAKGESKGRI